MAKRRSLIATVLGLLSLCGTLLLWAVMLAPPKWHYRFPGGAHAATFTLLLAILFSSIAGIWGRRRWLFVTVFGLVTVLYVWFFLGTPIWY
jgi:hypothetical protein